FPIRHPRCGTSFLLFVAFVGVLVYGLLGWPNLLLRAVVRLLFFPVVAGVAYEVLRASARAQGWLFRAVTAPGLALQRLTTAEPDDDQLEVALVALRACQEEESEEESALRHAGSHA
ncbi:MAG: DUF1385 domain-containing protein, partial [Clostridia bacterium]|nr:DUF1385 domain-containing protein [Clostridia bacterium]